MSFLKNKWFIILAIAVAVAIAAAFTLKQEKKPQYFTAQVTKGDVRSVVEATGTINAVTTVQVGSQVSGTIQTLNADFNSRVKKGQVVARIDPALFQGAVGQAQADLENAKANVAASKANLEKSKASSLQAQQDYNRTVSLTKEGVMSQQQLDAAKATYDAAVAQVSANDAALKQAAAQVQQRQAALTVAQTNLEHTIITAPIDGTVVARSVDVGQTVAASLQAPTLFTIAQDLTKMQVYAKTDESDVGQIHPGQKITFKVDAFPKDTFTGVVSQVRMNSTVVQNVVTYDTIIDFNNPELKLFPGMTAYVTIPVAEAANVLKLPNGAIRFRPSMSQDEIKAAYQKAGIQFGGGGQRSGQSADSSAASSAATGSAPAAQGDQQASAGSQRQRGGNGQGGNGDASARHRMGGSGDQPGGGSTTANAAPNGTSSDNAGNTGGRQARSQDNAIVWKLTGKDKQELVPVRVKLGITDRTNTEVVQVLNGNLNDGDELVIGVAGRSASAGGQAAPGARPGGGGRPGGR